jgi:hypothetical protein
MRASFHHVAQQYCIGERRHRGAQQQDPFETETPVENRKSDFREPLEREPAFARAREGKRIGFWNGARIEDVVAGTRVEPNVAIC